MRLETGIVQEGNDWPGVFIRGDNALMGYAPALHSVLKQLPDGSVADSIAKAQCEGLLQLLRSCDVRKSEAVQHVRLTPKEKEQVNE